MKIGLSCDQLADELKKDITLYLQQKGHQVLDFEKEVELDKCLTDKYLYEREGQKKFEDEQHHHFIMLAKFLGIFMTASQEEEIRIWKVRAQLSTTLSLLGNILIQLMVTKFSNPRFLISFYRFLRKKKC